MNKMQFKHYGGIDGLRAFSAIGIILMHVRANSEYHIDGFIYNKIIPHFTNLVFLFMVISGFCMCCGYYEKISDNNITVVQFYRKRYEKIWPFFAMLCALDLFISPSIKSVFESFANLTLCFGLLPNANIEVIGVGWFLGLVFVFYLFFPFFCFLLSDKRRAWFSFIIALVFNMVCSKYFFDESHVPGNFTARHNFLYSSVFFFAGGLIFLYRKQLETVVKKYRWLILFICMAAVFGYYSLNGSVPIMLVLFSLCLIYTLGIAGGILQNPVTKFLGGISMEIYLCHMVIFRVIEKIHCTHMFENDVLSYVLTAVGTVVGAVLFSVIVKKGIGIIRKRIQKHIPSWLNY